MLEFLKAEYKISPLVVIFDKSFTLIFIKKGTIPKR